MLLPHDLASNVDADVLFCATQGLRMAMEALLRFDVPLDLNLLEQVVSSLYQGSSPQQVSVPRRRVFLAAHPPPIFIADKNSRLLACNADQSVAAASLTAAGKDLRRGGVQRAQLVPR